MVLEVITLTEEDTLEAEQFGADRVELVREMAEGGLSPSEKVIKHVLSKAHIPAQIMVRPHSRGFVYDEADWQAMKKTIETIRTYGGRRIVIGAITEDQTIDTAFLDRLMTIAADFDITFHRAFDELTDQIAAYKILAQYKNIKRILTSGGQ